MLVGKLPLIEDCVTLSPSPKRKNNTELICKIRNCSSWNSPAKQPTPVAPTVRQDARQTLSWEYAASLPWLGENNGGEEIKGRVGGTRKREKVRNNQCEKEKLGIAEAMQGYNWGIWGAVGRMRNVQRRLEQKGGWGKEIEVWGNKRKEKVGKRKVGQNKKN